MFKVKLLHKMILQYNSVKMEEDPSSFHGSSAFSVKCLIFSCIHASGHYEQQVIWFFSDFFFALVSSCKL